MKVSLVSILILITQLLSAQSRLVCELRKHPRESLEPYADSIRDSASEKYLKKVISSIGLDMNFQVKSCQSKWCNHSSASLLHVKDDIWTRTLLYNGESLASILQDSSNLQQSILLTHEIGHHLGNHNMVMMRERHKVFREFCDVNSSHYSKEACEEKFSKPNRGDSRLFIFFELIADRYSGYLLAVLGYDILDIESAFLGSLMDTMKLTRFHPSDADRLEAIKQGHGFALEDIEHNSSINIHKLTTPKNYEGALRIGKKDSVIAEDISCSKMILDEVQYKAADHTPMELLDVGMVGHCLKLKLKIPYGCEDTEVKLINSGYILETMPPQQELVLVHDDLKQCPGTVIKEYYFDLSGYQSSERTGLMILNIGNLTSSSENVFRKSYSRNERVSLRIEY